MEHYVTIFDNLFAPQGLALQRSMERSAGSYTLWILCVDEDIFNTLNYLSLKNVKPLKLSDFETPELIQLKSTRTIAEYCWTLTPFGIKFVFDLDTNIERVTYIDADIWFIFNPKSIFLELENSGKEVLITEHAYAPQYDQSATSGKYCVQFMVFNREKGEIVREWWEKQCVDWCFARFEDGKFGDQKYLDDWSERFDEYVHVLKNKELILAPWNAIRYPYSSSIIYHFHGLRLLKNKKVLISGNYLLPSPLVKNIYKKYIQELSISIKILKLAGWNYSPQTKAPSLLRIIAWSLQDNLKFLSFSKIFKIK